MCVCACVRVCVCVRFSTFQTPITHKRLEISTWNLVRQWINNNPLTLFSWQLMPDLWFYGILNFLKKGRGSSNFSKIRAIVLKLPTNILHPSRNFGIEFGLNRLKRSHFFRFSIFCYTLPSICYTLSRVSLKRIPTISFFKHVIIWQIDFCKLTYCFQLCVNCLFFFVFLLLSGFLVQWLR